MHIKSRPQLNQSLLLYRLPCNGDVPAAALLRDNLFIILLIPLVAVSAVRSVCVRTVITVVPDSAHYEEYHLFISIAPLYYITHIIHYFEPVQTDGQL